MSHLINTHSSENRWRLPEGPAGRKKFLTGTYVRSGTPETYFPQEMSVEPREDSVISPISLLGPTHLVCPIIE